MFSTTTEAQKKDGSVSLIILTYNERRYLEPCLRSLDQGVENFFSEVIIVDNGSVDGTHQWVQRAYPSIKIIRNEKNLGVAGGRNIGMTHAAGAYRLFLDVDTEVDPGALQTLHSFMEEHPAVGVAGPRLIYPDGSPQYSGRRFPTPVTFFARAVGLPDEHPLLRTHLMCDDTTQTPRRVDWVLGACHIVRKKVFDDIGIYDKNFFLVYDDVDLCYRATKKGWKVMYVPNVTVKHHYQRKSARAPLWSRQKRSHLKSAVRFFIKRYTGYGL